MKTSRHKYNNLHNVMVDAMRRAEPLRTFLVLSLLLLLVGSQIASGENNLFMLSGKCQSPQSGDEVKRIQISYIEPSGCGICVTWDFRDVEVINADRAITYFTTDTLLCATAGQTTYYYRMQCDTLYRKGYENNLTLMEDSIAAIEMVFPMALGDSIGGDFYLKGLYCMRKQIASAGHTTIVADGYGMIYMPEGDTIHNVLRVKRINDSFVRISRHDDHSAIDVSADSLLRLVDVTYSWYAEGYRYPVAESHKYTYSRNGEILSESVTAYLCPPSEQRFADDDKDNMAVRSQSRTTYNETSSQTPENNQSLSLREDIVISQSGEILTIATLGEYDKPIVYLLTDIQGRVFSTGDCQSLGITEVDISALPLGDYILSVGIGEEQIIYKFTMKH